MSTPLRVVAAVLLHEGRVLLGKRAPPRREAGSWELPGGKVEPGETDEEALVRELAEELGVDVRPVRLLASVVHHYPHASIELVAWECALVAGEPEAREHSELRWLLPADVPALPLAPADRELWGRW